MVWSEEIVTIVLIYSMYEVVLLSSEPALHPPEGLSLGGQQRLHRPHHRTEGGRPDARTRAKLREGTRARVEVPLP